MLAIKFFACMVVLALGYFLCFVIPRVLIDEGMDFILVIYVVALISLGVILL